MEKLIEQEIAGSPQAEWVLFSTADSITIGQVSKVPSVLLLTER